MSEVLTVELLDGKEANVTKVMGYNDGYYWEYEIQFRVERALFSINTAGSCSGWIKGYYAIDKDLKHMPKLSGVINDYKLNYDFETYDAVTRDDVRNAVQGLYEDFIKSGAKESYKYFESEDEDAVFECHVDGKPRDPANNGWLKKYVEVEK